MDVLDADGPGREDGDDPERDRRSGERSATPLYRSGPVLGVFLFLAGAWSLQHVVDIYVHPVVRWTFVVPYLVTLFLFDNGYGEGVVYAVEPFLPIPGPVLWEVGNLLVYYLVALGVGAVVRVAALAVRYGRSDGSRK